MTFTNRQKVSLDSIVNGDCIEVMGRMASAAVDFVLTDPPYIARYRSRTGQSVINDDNGAWLQPAFTQMYRLLKPGSFCVSFYGWSKADRFIAAWRSAGFRMVGHLVFRKKIRLIGAFPALPARAGLSPRQGRRHAAGSAGAGCARLDLYRQPAASDAKAGADPASPHRGLLPARHRARSFLRLGLDTGRRQGTRTPIRRNRT